jgi:hypothetical protein
MPRDPLYRFGLIILASTVTLAVAWGATSALGGGQGPRLPYEGPVWYVATYGSNETGDGSASLPFATIVHAVSHAASGDTVAIYDGVYSGPGNVNVSWTDRDMHFRSVSGDPEDCVIDCTGATGFGFTQVSESQAARLSFSGLCILRAQDAITARRDQYWLFPRMEVRVHECRLKNGGNGLLVQGSAEVDSSEISGNNGTAVAVEYGRIELQDVVMRDNGVGVSLLAGFDSFDHRAINVDMIGNDLGMSLWIETGTCLLMSCCADSSAGDGISIYSSSGATLALVDCSVVGNGQDGMLSDMWVSVSVTNSRVSGNGSNGIECMRAWGATELDGVRLTGNGGWGIRTEGDLGGGGLLASSCILAGNGAGGICAHAGEYPPLTESLTSTVISDNEGPGIHFVDFGEIPQLNQVTIAGNVGPGVIVENSEVTAANLLIAFNDSVSVDVRGTGLATLTCCDLYGNAGGDWVGSIAGQLGLGGNICADPLFCGEQSPEDPWSLASDSPCAPEYNPVCGLIGARPVGCGYAAVEPRIPLPTSSRLLPAQPNPFWGSTAISYDLPAASRVTLCVYDLAGRLVRDLSPGAQMSAGRHVVMWDGRDQAGRRAAAAVYSYQLAAETWQAQGRVVVLR